MNRRSLASAKARVQQSEPDPSAFSLQAMAHILMELDRPEEARTALVRAIARAEVEGSKACELQMSLALALQAVGDLQAAGDAAERALAVFDVEYPDQPARPARFLLGYAFILRDRGEIPRAKALARESLELEQSVWPQIGRHLERDALLNRPDPP